MNKKTLLTLFNLFLLVAGTVLPEPAHAQISEGGTPTSFNYPNTLKSDISTVRIPIRFSVEDMKTVDQWQVSQGAPLKVGKLIDTDLTIDNAGGWTTLPDGQKIWQLRIQAKDAIALMLSFKDFYIPEKGKLFIYNADKTQVIGAFTHRTNPPTKEYATEFLAGDEIILEYETDDDADEQPRLAIDAVGYGYNHLYVSRTKAYTSPGDSGSCMVNINCEEGDAWQREKNGVCLMTLLIGKFIYYCSGSLVNNTAEDLKPYILSAYHCIDLDETVTQEDLNKYVFYFHFEHTDCENTSAVASYKTITGCKKVAGIPLEGGSDGLLLLLNQYIPENYNVYYNGWDRSNTAARSGVGIHHPAGDYMKISTFSKGAVTGTWYGIDSIVGAAKAHWNVVFDQTPNGHSVTEGGSSGSPLFNQNKLIVGTLSGGTSSCEAPNQANAYGKLYYHWDQYSKDDTARMDIYLDPSQTGVTQLPGRYATPQKATPANLTLSYKNGEVELNWEAPVSDNEKPVQYGVYRNNRLLEYVTSTTYTDTDPETGTQLYSVSAIYADGEESAVLSRSIYIYELKVPTDVTAAFIDNGVKVNWKEPLYQQTIYWGNGIAKMMIGFGQPFYFGQKWDANDLAVLDKHLIDTVLFIPVAGVSYSLLVKQGNREYRQDLKNLSANTMNDIGLKEPFVIDASKELIVAFYADTYKQDVYPAIVDEGPAINGKGNLISSDGINWEYLYDPSEVEEEDFDNNFLLAVLVNSKQKEIPVTKAASDNPIVLSRSSARPLSAQKAQSGSSLRSSEATAFPEITGYNIYRNDVKIGTVSDRSITEFTDKQVPEARLTYQVSALYGDNESKKSMASTEINVHNENIRLPEITLTHTLFTDRIQLVGNKKVRLLEVISSDGKTVMKQQNPEAVIYTGFLAPGIYFFRLHTDEEIKIIKAVKTN